ncbi:MAG: phenylalanine--tRNA ligase subunit alpha [Oligoflexia bacterium]|nr:phenylalanine--tRNA ligase subunit alpha [Oligoflexia bacterium]
MIEKINQLSKLAHEAIEKASSTDALYEVKVKYLGKQGLLSTVLKDLGKLSPDERKTVGLHANNAKAELEEQIDTKTKSLKTLEQNQKLQSEKIDVSLPGLAPKPGSIHPINKVMNEMCSIFSRLGFSVRTGPHIENAFYNFDALNIPADHPSRDLQDTFYVDDGIDHEPGKFSPWVLRTHTSPVQTRTMLTEKPPLRIISPGGVYRSDSDTSHSPHFHQIEGLLIDKNVSLSDLKGVLGFFAKEFFGSDIKVRLRPSYFPFVEPGAELDASCPLCKGKGCSMCKHTGWIELAGCGMVHPEVFKAVGIEYPTWNGFAFGMGIERMAVVKYGVSHIGLFSENDLRFLENFKI